MAGAERSLFVLPFLAAYFARQRQLDARGWALSAAPFALAALLVNVYPYGADSATEMLVALHLPVVLWFAVAYPYMGGTIRSHERRMDFVRFTGEWFIYYVLIALGGGVLMALTAAILEPTGVDVDRIAEWVLPSGAAGAVIVAAWLVESKQRVVENMAPVLTMLFTPLFAVMLAGAAVVYAVTGLGDAFDRDLVSVFDALLLVVLALVLYGMSARDPSTSPEWMDGIQLVAVVSALVLDVMVLGTMVARIGDLGFSPNRTAALGLNLVLLVNLAGAAWLSARFLAGRSRLHRLERWQTSYLPVFALWAAAVVVVLPPLFAPSTDRESHIVMTTGLGVGGDVELALEGVGVPSYVLDTTGIVRWINPAAERLLGDVRGRHITSVVAPEDSRRARELFARKVLGTAAATDAPGVLLSTAESGSLWRSARCR